MKLVAAAMLAVAAATIVGLAFASPSPAPTPRISEAAHGAASADHAEAARPAAAGGVGILEAATRARAVVTGTITQPSAVDRHGWRAGLVVDDVLRGDVRLGATITIAWEELATSRPVRFGDGDRVLAVLDPLPTQSLWRQRFPQANGDVLVIAANGDAFLRAPDGGTVGALEHYLALTSEARADAPGARRLADVVRDADAILARDALTTLAADTRRIDLLGDDGAASLLDAARDPHRAPDVRGGALRLAAEHRLPHAREVARALAAPGSAIRPDAYRALASFPDGLTPSDVDALLGDASPDLRVVGVEVARDPALRPRVLRLAHEDAAPAVRLAAGEALLTRGGVPAIKDVIPLLDDGDATVRRGVAEAIGNLGAGAVDPLQAVAESGREPAALAAVVGLSRAGSGGTAALQLIAKSNPNGRVRQLAGLALGKAPFHDD